MYSKVAFSQNLAGVDFPEVNASATEDTWEHNRVFSILRSLSSAREKSSWFRTFGHFAAGIASILFVTFVCRGESSAKVTTVGFAYLLIILVSSTFMDFGTLVCMSLSATMAYDYFFLPPVGTFNLSDPRDWLALFSFLVTAVIGSRLSTKARQRAEEAERQRQELKKLYKLSQKLMGLSDASELFRTIPKHIIDSFGMKSASLYLCERRETFSSGTEIPQLGIRNLMGVVDGDIEAEALKGFFFAPLRLGTKVMGSMGISEPLPSRETCEALGTLIAIAIDRCRAIQRVTAMEALRERERFKSILLDAITHDFKTPLTSIKISATGLLDDLEFGREQRRELLTIIDEECDRINGLVGDACELARLESGDVHLNVAPHSIGTLISAAVADCGGVSESRSICLDVKDQEWPLLVDLSLAKKVLTHLIMNANLYSEPGQPITITTELKGMFQFISVSDHGPGIDQKELVQIFEKFYRGESQRLRVHGTGMGLPIAKAIVEAHGGAIDVVSRKGVGSVFTFSLPLAQHGIVASLAVD